MFEINFTNKVRQMIIFPIVVKINVSNLIQLLQKTQIFWYNAVIC